MKPVFHKEVVNLSRFYQYKSLEEIEENMMQITGDLVAISVIESLIKEVRELESAVNSLQQVIWEGPNY